MRLFLLFLVLVLPSVSFPADYSMQLQQVRLPDLARIVYGDVLKQSFVLDDDFLRAQDLVTVDWLRLPKKDLDVMTRDLLTLRGFELVQQGSILLIRKRKQDDDDLLIYEPRYRSARYLSDILAKVADAQQMGTRTMQASPEFQQAVSKQPEKAGSVGAMISQSANDQLAYQCSPAKCARLKKLLIDLDSPEAQVLLKAAVYEVGTSKTEGTALQIAASVLQGQFSVSTGSAIAGASQLRFATSNLDAVLSLLDQDGRFNSISRPMLRVKTGSQAKFSVGQQVPILGGISYDRNGNPVQTVEYRQAGTIFTVRPDVRQEVIDLDITQELSNFVATTTGINNSPTLLQRTAQSQLVIRPGEVVVFAGLEEQKDDEANSRFFGFSVGQKKSSTTSQVLLFIEALKI